jgi:hypothetical protein
VFEFFEIEIRQSGKYYRRQDGMDNQRNFHGRNASPYADDRAAYNPTNKSVD